MPNEADTCRKSVVPKLQAAGWDNDPHSIAEQRTFTDGRIVVRGNRSERRQPKRADYLLRYTRDFPIAVVEAKASYRDAANGLQQAKDYAEILDLKFAYATNGQEIIEFDYLTGIERILEQYPTPAELWTRLRASERLADTAAQRLLTPANHTTGKEPRYYQRITIDREVQTVSRSKKCVLLTIATGTGKTVVAFQICWKLSSSKRNAKGDPTRKTRILCLTDRNFLVDTPAFDVDPAFASQEEIDEYWQMICTKVLITIEPDGGAGELSEQVDGIGLFDSLSTSIKGKDWVGFRKYYFYGGLVNIATKLVHELDANGKRFSVIKLNDHIAKKMQTICAIFEHANHPASN